MRCEVFCGGVTAAEHPCTRVYDHIKYMEMKQVDPENIKKR
jgi:hypothetical protein